MRLKKSEYYGAGLNILLSCIYVWYLFRTLLKAPGHAFLSNGGDGSKNYYTYLYHVLFGKGFHFEGMHYPWGEHISFTDNQPLLAFPLSYLQSLFHFSVNDLLAIMNLLIVVSFMVTSFILYRFFSRMGANPFVSAVSGLLITFLAPNFYRVFGHFGLCYTFNIALTFYYLFLYRETGKNRYVIALFLLSFLVAFVHMYNLLLSMVIVFFFASGMLLLERNKMRERFMRALPLFGVVVLSFVAVKLVFFFSDPLTDRPVSPWGILHYVTTLKQVFTTEFTNLGKTFSLLFDGFATNDLDEGYAYAGIIPLFYLLFILLNAVYYFFRNTELKLYKPVSVPELYFLLIAFFAYLMAIGFPFTYGLSSLLDLMPAIKQFRSLGRLSIIVYFSLSMACVLRISLTFKEFTERKANIPAFYLLTIVIFLWAIEIFGYSKYVQRRADETQHNYKNFFQLNAASDPVVIKTDTQYQCLLGLPLFCVGSEKVGKDVDSEFSGDLFRLSINTGLPIVNTLMSRSSWKQSFQLMRLGGGPYSDKELFTNALNDKKILLLRLKEAYLTRDEESILAFCSKTGEQGRIEYYNLDWQELIRHQSAHIDSLNQLPVSAFAGHAGPVFVNHFDAYKSKEVLFGSGAADISTIDSVILLDANVSLPAGSFWEFSVWARVVSEDYRMPHCTVLMYDNEGREIMNRNVHTQNASDNAGFWFRTSAELEVKENVSKVRIVFRNDDQAALYLDEFLLKPLDAFYVSEDPAHTQRMYNNHLITIKQSLRK